MKFFFRWFLFFSIVCCNVAFAGGKVHEVSTLLGAPNREMPFVQSLLKNTVMLSPDSAYGDLTTGVFYFLWKNGAESVQAFEVLKDSGNAVLSDVFIALDAASENSSIVLAPLAGESQEQMCGKMAEKSETAFLVSLGEGGYTLSPFFTKCASRNILFVTMLNVEQTDLAYFASYGPLVRLAVPGVELEAPVDKSGRKVSFLSDIFGMSVAAGRLASFQRSHSSLKGEALISAFLVAQEALPALRGKIPGSRALRKFAR